MEGLEVEGQPVEYGAMVSMKWRLMIGYAALAVVPLSCSKPAPKPTTLKVERLKIGEAQKRIWTKAKGTERYREPTEQTRRVVARALRELVQRKRLTKQQVEKLNQDLGDVGYELREWTIDKVKFWALLERPIRGGGSYLVPKQKPAKANFLLQAPHAYYDLGTGQLALQTFVENSDHFVAFFSNNMHRYGGKGQKKERAGSLSPEDACHNPKHLLSWLTEAVLPEVDLVVQLHGFSKRPDLEGVGIVLSDGSKAAEAHLAHMKQKLGASDQVLLFPTETRALGATTNVQARLCRSANVPFLHVEMSSDVRKRWRKSSDARGSFVDALRAVTRPASKR